MAWVGCRREELTWTGPRVEPTWSATWPSPHRGFCPRCGTHLVSVADDSANDHGDDLQPQRAERPRACRAQLPPSLRAVDDHRPRPRSASPIGPPGPFPDKFLMPTPASHGTGVDR
ncbi:hypothetical protein [Streptomyces sp. NPDC005231]|uniref:hypothetical protein n=1 Tax=Streptomyces sp. NPDC005231 TaxID=3157026 RepID=UPI0033BFB3D1